VGDVIDFEEVLGRQALDELPYVNIFRVEDEFVIVVEMTKKNLNVEIREVNDGEVGDLSVPAINIPLSSKKGEYR